MRHMHTQNRAVLLFSNRGRVQILVQNFYPCMYVKGRTI